MVTLEAQELKQNGGDSVDWEVNNNPKCEINNELQLSELINKSIKINEDETNRRNNETNDVASAIENYQDSSIHGIPSAQCSDVEDDVDFLQIDENDEVEGEEEENGWMTNLPVSSVEHETTNGQVLPSLDRTTFGKVTISNSTSVRVGNTTLYKGPVTIKQFVYTNGQANDKGDIANGRISDINPNDIPNVKSDSSTPIFPVHREYDRVKKWLWTWRCAAILCILGLILVTTIVVVSVLLTKNNDLSPLSPAMDPNDIVTEDVRFVKRTEWGAQPPENLPNPLQIIPAPYVIISHTASEPCTTQAQCVQRVRTAQTMHIEGNRWDDIGYNFLVGGDGLAYIGRGWDVEGAHTYNYNKKSIGISAIGTFNNIVPPQRQLYALKKVIEVGVQNGKIAKDYKLMGHRQLTETLSPGEMLYRIIKTWDHWSDGYLFDKEAILEYILTKKREYARKLKEYELQKQKEEEETNEKSANEELQKLQNFFKFEKNIVTRPTNKDESQSGSSISNMADGRDKSLPSFWIPSKTPEAKALAVKKPDKTIYCPVSGKPLKLKDLINIKFMEVKDPDDKKSLIVKEARYMCPITHDVLSNSVPCVVIKTTGDVITMECFEKLIKKDWINPLDGTKITESDIIPLQRGGTGYSAVNDNLEGKHERPVLQA